MAVTFTKEQQDVINAKDGTLLVSAAAGSGKTAVLVERIISKIVSDKNPISIDRLLIVTFTNAAAFEMKEKIIKAIEDKIKENSGNDYLKKQLILCQKAKICTIDSFCIDFVKKYGYILDISPNFKVSGNDDLNIIREEILKDIIEKEYEVYDEKFSFLCSVFCEYKSDSSLFSVINSLISMLNVIPDREKYFKDAINEYKKASENYIDTYWYKLNKKELILNLNHYLSVYDEFITYFSECENHPSLQLVINERKNVDETIKCLESNNLKEAVLKLDFSFDRYKTVKKEEIGYYEEFYKSYREEVKEYLKKANKNYSLAVLNTESDFKKAIAVVEKLRDIVLKYFESSLDYKIKENIFGFSDIEYITVKLLNENGKRTPLSKKVSLEYDEIMIDEYQDINEIQECIFSSISKDEKNMFMVGDIKQSIYRFRQSNPKIFLDKKNSFDFYNENDCSLKSKIYLNKNFRSRQSILDFTNQMFKNILSIDAGEMEYQKEDYLYYGGLYGEYEKKEEKINIDFIYNKKKDETLLGLEEANAYEKEAVYVVNKVKEIVKSKTLITAKDGTKRPIEYKDIAITYRSGKGSILKFLTNAFKDAGIGVNSEAENEFFTTYEVRCLLSILRAIDNPLSDLDVLALMRSPLFSFDFDLMLKIKEDSKNKPLYLTLKEKYSENSECKKIISFLDYYKELSFNVKTYELILNLFERDNLLDLFYNIDKKKTRKENLIAVYNFAFSFEEDSFKGLYKFIYHITKIEEKGKFDLSPKAQGEKENGVTIITVHKSKGLEYPYLIICGLLKEINREDLNRELICDEEDSFAFKFNFLEDEYKDIYYNSLNYNALKFKKESQLISEELRLLYVAFTRAREKLHLVITLDEKKDKDIFDVLNDKIPNSNNSAYYILKSKSYSDILLHGLSYFKDYREFLQNCSVQGDYLNFYIANSQDFNLYETVELSENDETSLNEEQLIQNSDENDHIMKNIMLSEISSKISVSNLKEDKNSGKSFKEESEIKKIVPFFISGRVNAMEVGTVVHKFFQNVNYDNLLLSGSEDEVKRLLDGGFLLPKEKDILPLKFVENFKNSQLILDLQKAKKVYREYRFNLKIDASYLNEEIKDEYTLVQGVIDLFYINENDEIILVDYKTDFDTNEEILKEKYEIQLNLYSEALKDILKKDVTKKAIYAVYDNTYVEI